MKIFSGKTAMLPAKLIRLKRTSKKSLILRSVRGMLNPWLIRLTASSDYDYKKSIILLGGARSGTTWLAEILNTIPESGLIFEPMYLPKVREARKAGVQWYTFRLPDENWPEGVDFFRKVFSGKILNPWTTSFMPVKRSLNTKMWVVKMIRGNMLLAWLLKQFPFLRPILLIRHPCAAILSMRQQGWPFPLKKPRLRKFESVFPKSKEIISRLEHPIEYAAALWCITYYPALLLSPYQRFLIVTYEGMVRDGQNETKRIFNFLNIVQPAESFKQLKRLSQMTKKDSPIHRQGDPLSKWKKELSSTEIQMIIQVVKQFGLDFYSRDIEPDYNRLYGPKPVAKQLD